MNNKMTKYGCMILIVLILCVSLPAVWLKVYKWQYCLFPPTGPNVEIIVSACEDPRLLGVSPNGRYISYGSATANEYQRWLLDTITNEKYSDTSCGDWWLDNTIRLGGYEKTANYSGGFMICDISDGTKVVPQWVENIPGAITQLADYTETYSPEVVDRFRNAKQVYYISFHRWAVALNPDFKTHPENSYVLTNRDTDPINSVLKFLTDNQISYHQIGYANDGKDLVSHNGRFKFPSAGTSGFYTKEGTRIGPVYDYVQEDNSCCFAYGWAYDDSGIYVQGNVIGTGGMFAIPPNAHPILKLDLPPEYLTPAARETRDARQNQENQVQMTLLVRGLVLFLLLIIGTWLFWWQKKVKRGTVK